MFRAKTLFDRIDTMFEMIAFAMLLFWLEIRAIFYWLLLWWLIPLELPRLSEIAQDKASQHSWQLDKKLEIVLCGHRFINLVHRGMGIYSPELTLRGSIAVWLFTRGRVWKRPATLSDLYGGPAGC